MCLVILICFQYFLIFLLDVLNFSFLKILTFNNTDHKTYLTNVTVLWLDSAPVLYSSVMLKQRKRSITIHINNKLKLRDDIPKKL